MKWLLIVITWLNGQPTAVEVRDTFPSVEACLQAQAGRIERAADDGSVRVWICVRDDAVTT